MSVALLTAYLLCSAYRLPKIENKINTKIIKL